MESNFEVPQKKGFFGDDKRFVIIRRKIGSISIMAKGTAIYHAGTHQI
jgi:hypothetical protein